MAKITAPILSLGGSGTIGKTITYAKWRGVPYARQRVVPANPQTAPQQFVRRMFALLREMWKLAPADLLAPWNSFASGRPFTGMNKFVGENVRVLNGEMDMSNFIGSPGAKGGLPPDDATSDSGGAGALAITVAAPAPPPGWSIVKAVAVAFVQQPPDGIFSGGLFVTSDAAAPYVPTFAGLESGETYVWAVWLVWEKPDESLAYSVSLVGTQVID